MGRAAVVVPLPLALVAFVVRTLAVLLLRRRRPAAAVAVERGGGCGCPSWPSSSS